MDIIPRFFRDPGTSFFLFGPRGTGKSTWLRSQFRGALFIDLLDPAVFRAYMARPERLIEVIDGNPGIRCVVIDEVQRAPTLLDVVHLLMEDVSRPHIQFILTGSSARKLKRTGIDLLAGRALLKTLHPFMAAELGSAFSMDRALEFGLLPLVLAAADPEQTLRSYAALYLREEVQAEALVRRIESFARFLEVMSFSHGSLVNTAAIARECQAGYKAVEGYIEVLEDLLLGFRVPPFTKRAGRETVRHRKFYYADAGIYRSFRPRGPLDRPQEIGGSALEGLVVQHLRAWLAYSDRQGEVSFWRTKAGLEVDFVVYGEGCFAAIEVKASRSIHPRDVRPLRAFLEDYPAAQVCLLYGGHERLNINGILCIPCEQFLAELIPRSELPIG